MPCKFFTMALRLILVWYKDNDYFFRNPLFHKELATFLNRLRLFIISSFHILKIKIYSCSLDLINYVKVKSCPQKLTECRKQFEKTSFNQTGKGRAYVSIHCRRYVDDIFVVRKSSDQLKQFQNQLGSYHVNISFNIEAKYNNKISFSNLKFFTNVVNLQQISIANQLLLVYAPIFIASYVTLTKMV